LQAFAKFGSDLDKATLAQLRRGERLREILKQGQYQPLDVAKQVFIIFMANQGYLDDIELENVSELEEELFNTLDLEHKDLQKEISTGKITEDILKKMNQICENVKKKF
jgi:F-type H+-transporting ATPase subunit alpha